MLIEEGAIVRSEAGRDQAGWYVVVKVDGDAVYIADGRKHKVEKPKRKNPRHLKRTRKRLEKAQYQTNQTIRRALNAYLSSSGTVTEWEVY